MLKFGDRVTAPRSWHDSDKAEGVITRLDVEDPEGWTYQVTKEDEGRVWTHKDETVLVPDPEKEAQDERIAQLTAELANTQVKLQMAEQAKERREAECLSTRLKWEQSEEERGKAMETIEALKTLVLDVSAAAAAKEAMWMASEAYNAKVEVYNEKATKAREALASFRKTQGVL